MIRFIREVSSPTYSNLYGTAANQPVLYGGGSPDGCLIGYCVKDPDTGNFIPLLSDDVLYYCKFEVDKYQALYGDNPIDSNLQSLMDEFMGRIKAAMTAMNSGLLGDPLQTASAGLIDEVRAVLAEACGKFDPAFPGNQQRQLRPLYCRINDHELDHVFEDAWNSFIEKARDYFKENSKYYKDTHYSNEFIVGLIAALLIAVFVAFPITWFLVTYVVAGQATGAGALALGLGSSVIGEELAAHLIGGTAGKVTEIFSKDLQGKIVSELDKLGIDPNMTLEDLLKIVVNDKDIQNIVTDATCEELGRQLDASISVYHGSTDCGRCKSDGEALIAKSIRELSKCSAGISPKGLRFLTLMIIFVANLAFATGTAMIPETVNQEKCAMVGNACLLTKFRARMTGRV